MADTATVLKRLRQGTQAELKQLVKVLGIDLPKDHEEVHIRIADAFFKATTVKDYRLSLRQTLDSVARMTNWKKPEVKDSAEDEWLEEYIMRGLVFANDPARATMSESDIAKVREQAEAALEGKIASPKESSDAAGFAVIAGFGALLYYAFLPVSIGVSVIWLLSWLFSPSEQKVLASTLLLIHIRKRSEFEAVLVAPEAGGDR